MTLVVEDGTGLSTANAYVSVADVDSYFLLRGNETWADAETSEKEAAIVRATFALDAKYSDSWIGIKSSQSQALQWPRIKELNSASGPTDMDGYEIAPTVIPAPLLNACAEVALIELSERFLVVATTRDDMIKSERVGPLSTTWMDGAASFTQKAYPHVDALLRGLAASASGTNVMIHLTEEELNQTSGQFDPFNFPEYFNLVKYP